MPSVLIPVADGTEELELVSVTNPLARAGVKYTLASVKKDSVAIDCARGIKLTAHALITDVVDEPFDMVILPGRKFLSCCLPLLLGLDVDKVDMKFRPQVACPVRRIFTNVSPWWISSRSGMPKSR